MKQNTAASVKMALMQLVFSINVHQIQEIHQIQEPIGSAPTYITRCVYTSTPPHLATLDPFDFSRVWFRDYAQVYL